MSDEESVNLTPGVVWTDAQLAVVRSLLVRAYRAEAALKDAAADLEYRATKASPAEFAAGYVWAAGRVREIVTELGQP